MYGENNVCGLTEYKELPIEYVDGPRGEDPDENPKEYSTKIDILDYNLDIYEDSTLTHDIPYEELFPYGIGVDPESDDISTRTHFENIEVRDMLINFFPFSGSYIKNYYTVNGGILNNFDASLFGIVKYIERNESLPDAKNQTDTIFILDEEPSCEQKMENMSGALGCILIKNASKTYIFTNASQQYFNVGKVDGTGTNFSLMLDKLKNGTTFFVDNFADSNTFYFSNLDDPSLAFLDDWVGLLDLHWKSSNLTILDWYIILGANRFLYKIPAEYRHCRGFILSGPGNMHLMMHTVINWSWFKNTYSDRFHFPMFSVNETVGGWLREESVTVTGSIDQVYRKQTDITPGVESHNVVAYRNISQSPDDAIVVLSNRIDGWWSETPGDSGVGGAILLGIAKYMEDYDITPKYDLAFLFTTGEEYGMRGAVHYVDTHPYGINPGEYNFIHWIGLDQLCMNYTESQNKKLTMEIYTKNQAMKSLIETIASQTNYEERTSHHYDFSVLNVTGGGSEDYVWNNSCGNTILLEKNSVWDGWHSTGNDAQGNNFQEGDSLINIDPNEVKVVSELYWNITKYFCVNPDCWFNEPATYTAVDSPFDTDDEIDSIDVTVLVTSILPSDKVRVNATVKSWPSNDVVFWKNYDFVVTSEGTEKTFTVTLPPSSTGATYGNYFLTLDLLNSTGRINDVALNTRMYDDTETQTGYVALTPRGNSIINKPNDITGPSRVKIGTSANFTTSAVDMNQDQMQYQWEWYVPFDINTTVGPIDSGEDCTANYTYDSWGTWTIQVRARDDYRYLFDGPETWNRYSDWSDWSEPFEVNVRFLIDFSMSCTSFSSAVSAQSAMELPSIQQIDSIYDAAVFGGTAPYNYTWTFNHERCAAQQKTVNYSFDEPGNYSVILNVTDNDGNFEEFSVNVSVMNLSASYNLSIPSPFAEIDENITFTDTSAVASGYQMTNWTWDFDDGTFSYDRNVTHAFTVEGLYNVSLIVRDNQSNSDISYQHILIFNDEMPPEIHRVNNGINLKNRWLQIMIVGLFNDQESGIHNALVNITYPNGSHTNCTMNHFVSDTYWFVFNDTVQAGRYNYTVWVTDYENNTSNTTGYSFTIPTAPVLFYSPATPADNTSSNDNWVNVNVTVLDPLNTSAFIDWNHSLKGYWPMESYNDTGVYDNSTYENFGTFQNGMTSRDNIVSGKYGTGLEFDGSDDYLDVGNSGSLDLGTGDFTFMVWEKSHTTLYSKKAMILTNNPASESWKGYGFGIINSPYLIVSQSTGNNITLQGTTDVTDNTWHHIAYVCRSGAYSIYVDGEEDASSGGIAVKNITNTQHTMIAYDGHCSSWCYFEGLLDEPQLFNRALGSEEINASYNNGLYQLSHNFTSLSDGTYSYYAHAIDTTGNQSNAETRQILIDTTPPTITDVNASPHTVGFGYNVTITADVVDNGSGVDLVTVQITFPNSVGNSSNYTMSLVSNDTYQYVFNDTWLAGQYNYTIWATDNTNNTASSSGHHFHVSAEATISIATLRNSYSGNQYINITDPPNPPEDYILVDRGLTWNTYYNTTSGANILETYQGPVNYQEENESWMPIYNTLIPLTSNHPAYVYGYRQGNDRGLYGVYFKSNAQQEWPVAFTYNKSNDPTIHAVRSKLVGVGYVDPQSNWAYEYLQNVQSSQGQVNDYSITYPDVFTGTDVTWSYGNTGLKEEITLSNATKTVLQNHPPSQYGLNDTTSYLVFITKLDYQGLNLYNKSGLLEGNVTISDAGVDFKDILGQFKCALPLGEAYELNNDSSRQKLTYRIVHLNGNTYLLSGLKASDLNAMTFPVVVDPTLTVYSVSNDGYIYNSGSVYSTVQSASSGTVDSSSIYITIGQKRGVGPTYYVYRGFVLFNTSALPSNAYLDDATLSLYKKDDYSATDFDITIQNGQPTYPHNPMQTGDYYRGYYSGNGGSLNTSRFTSGYNAIPLNNLSWINTTGITKLCLRSSRDINGNAPTGNEYINVYSGNAFEPGGGITYKPKLVITYRNQSKIKNTGSTDITGYLLIQVQYYNSSQGEWLVEDDTINEATPRTVTSGNQLALDTIFNGNVRASDLTHGTGVTYRVYTAFRDSIGNILKTNDDVDLEAWWQFSKT